MSAFENKGSVRFHKLASRSRGGGKVRIPRCMRDLQVERESLVWDFSPQRLFHGLDLFFGERRQELSLRAVVSDAMPCDHEGQGSVQVLMDDRLASGHCMAPVGALELHNQVVKACGVVLINCALESLRKNHFQIPVPAGYKRRSALCCRNRKTAVELGDVVLIEKVVGRFQSSDPAQSQLLRQSSLPGGEVAFRASPRLRRIGRDHMHSQFLHGTAHLRGTLIIDLAAALWRQPEMGSTVGIQRTEQSLLFNHWAQSGHHCYVTLFWRRSAQRVGFLLKAGGASARIARPWEREDRRSWGSML